MINNLKFMNSLNEPVSNVGSDNVKNVSKDETVFHDVERANEEKKIKNLLNNADDVFVEVQNKLSVISNILSESIVLDNVGFKTDRIEEIKKQL